MICTDPLVETWQTCSREPTCSASRQSRAMIASSATAGQPASPRRSETTPSFIWAPSVRRGSWACWAMTPSNALTYSRARRMSWASETHMPSSEKTRTLAGESAMAPSSARRSPFRPTVTAPTGWTSQYPASRRSRRTCSTTPAVAAAGAVLGRVDVAVSGVPAQPPDLFDDAGSVGDGVGVGHGEDGGVAAHGGGPRPGGDGFCVFASRLPQVGVEVDESGQGNGPGGVDHFGAVSGEVGADREIGRAHV